MQVPEEARAAAREAIDGQARRLGIVGLALDDVVDLVLGAAVPHVDAHVRRQLVPEHDERIRQLTARLGAAQTAQTAAEQLAAPLRRRIAELETECAQHWSAADSYGRQLAAVQQTLVAIEALPYVGREPRSRVLARGALGR